MSRIWRCTGAGVARTCSAVSNQTGRACAQYSTPTLAGGLAHPVICKLSSNSVVRHSSRFIAHLLRIVAGLCGLLVDLGIPLGAFFLAAARLTSEVGTGTDDQGGHDRQQDA